MADEATIDFEEHPFTCPYCGKETIVESPMDTILVGRADCETLRERVSYRERRAEAVATIEKNPSGKGF
jgi:hypothetical protein